MSYTRMGLTWMVCIISGFFHLSSIFLKIFRIFLANGNVFCSLRQAKRFLSNLSPSLVKRVTRFLSNLSPSLVERVTRFLSNLSPSLVERVTRLETLWCCRRPAGGKQESTGLLLLNGSSLFLTKKKRPAFWLVFSFWSG